MEKSLCIGSSPVIPFYNSNLEENKADIVRTQVDPITIKRRFDILLGIAIVLAT